MITTLKRDSFWAAASRTEKNCRPSAKLKLLLATAAGVALCASNATAQTDRAQNSKAGDNQLQEVVVTATRQADTVNRVPLSVTAETQKALDQRGIRTITDLQATVPALVINQQLASGVANIALRGILQGGQGASTTGFYLDDTPLQKRNVGGGVATANGTPLPPLFDLERVEVLRGPQGTLFGGDSEGGTIRYIQPAPSLTTYSTYDRAQASTTRYGDPSYEAGVAVGGPIIRDKLGFRASVFDRHTGGFIDRVNVLTNQVFAKDVNSADVHMGRLALTWAPTEQMRITADYFGSRDHTNSLSSSFNLSEPNAIVVPTECFNANATPTGGAYANGINTSPTSPIASLPVGASARTIPYPVGIGTAACNTLAAQGKVTHTTPGQTYGPYNLGPYQSLALTLSPTTTNLYISRLTFDYDFGNMTMKAITSYISDENKTVTGETSQLGTYRLNATFGGVSIPSGGLQFSRNYPGSEFSSGFFNANNRRRALTEEVRFASAGNARPLSWVAGVFYSNSRVTQGYGALYDLDTLAQTLYGISAVQRYGVPALETAPGLANGYDLEHQNLKDVDVAAFGEANYWITDRLRVTGGIRFSRVSFDYVETFIGPVIGTNVPNPTNGSATTGSLAESPVTPKVAAEYQLNSNDLIYVSASKGFRAGGVNAYIGRSICQPAFDAYGIGPDDLPRSYKSDSVWSYEAGTKLRLFGNRLQLNDSVYQINWSNPQVTTTPGCGQTFTTNAISAQSRGFEIEAQALIFRGLTVNSSFGYNDAKYTATSVVVTGTTGRQLVATLDGQKFALPPWTFNFGARYETDVATDVRAYIRGDFRYTKGYLLAPFGTANWNPDSNIIPSQYFLNLRLGVERGNFDVNLFVNNALNNSRGQLAGGRTGCTPGDPTCSTFTSYNPLITTNYGTPREVGLQVVYRR